MTISISFKAENGITCGPIDQVYLGKVLSSCMTFIWW